MVSKSTKRKAKGKKPKAVFLDRDGNLIHDPGYLDSLDKIRFYKNSIKALKLFKKNGYKLIVLTNQSGVARGYFPESFVHETHRKMDAMLKKHNVKIDGYYMCVHHEKHGVGKYLKDCNCRKPKPGMVLAAKKKFNIDLKRSFVIGDKLSDVELGHNVGSGSVLVLTGKGRKQKAKIKRTNVPDIIARDLYSAAKKICTGYEIS